MGWIEDCFDVVKSVGTLLCDVQTEVQFGVWENNHGTGFIGEKPKISCKITISVIPLHRDNG